MRKFYETGQIFLTVLPDGTGNILYPFKSNFFWIWTLTLNAPITTAADDKFFRHLSHFSKK